MVRDLLPLIVILLVLTAVLVAVVAAMERRMKDRTVAHAIMGSRRPAPLRVQLVMLVLILGLLTLVALGLG